MTDTRRLELVAVETPKSWACTMPECDGTVLLKSGDEFFRCKKCHEAHWFREVVPMDIGSKPSNAQTIAMLEGAVESAKRGAAKGADTETLAGQVATIVASHVESHRNADLDRRLNDKESQISSRCETIVRQAKTIADFEAEVATLSETIVKHTKRIAELETESVARGCLVIDKQKELADLRGKMNDLESTPAPPADSRPAFEVWAETFDYRLGRRHTGYLCPDTDNTYRGWLAALEWRGGKPKDIAEVVHGCVEGSGELIVCGVYVAAYGIKSIAEGDADRINENYVKAHGCEGATDGN